jgi:polysaccharide biosynthesis/export protein
LRERSGIRATVPFGAVVYETGNNVWAWPGDTIYLYSTRRRSWRSVFRTSRDNFGSINGASCLRKQSALRLGFSTRSRRTSVPLRGEPRAPAERLGVNCAKLEGPTVPIVHHETFRDPDRAGMALDSRLVNCLISSRPPRAANEFIGRKG